ncbi:MAG: hypothetical protein ACI3XX_05370 [Eubacteriales bacterium]
MFKVKIADFVIEIDNKYDFVKNQCREYEVSGETCDFAVSCTYEEIEAERKLSPESDFSNGYLESICLYRHICLELPERDALIFHSAIVEVDKDAYAFAAKSGTGKSTHISLWKKYLGNRVKVINGDKPIIRFNGSEFIAYGTPWCGKEGWGENTSAPLKSICFIERSEKNKIEKLDKPEAASRFMRQILMPADEQKAIKTLDLADKMLKTLDTWILYCNISEEAAKIAYESMSGKDKK